MSYIKNSVDSIFKTTQKEREREARLLEANRQRTRPALAILRKQLDEFHTSIPGSSLREYTCDPDGDIPPIAVLNITSKCALTIEDASTDKEALVVLRDIVYPRRDLARCAPEEITDSDDEKNPITDGILSRLKELV